VAIHALTFTRCVGITETVNGGVLSVKGPVNVIITDSNFNQNRAKNGGVLSVLGYSNNAPKSAPTIRLNGDNVFYNNSALMSGGAIYSENSFVDLSGATFEANTASLGGAIYWTSTYGLSLNGASFRSNRATSSNDAGSALYTSSSGIVNINDVTFTSNHANGKGTVMFYFGPRATLKSVTFTSNTAYGGGAGVALSSQTIANIEDGVFVSNSGAKGAALMLSGGSKLNAKRVVFRQNRSAFGALYFQSSSGTVQSSVFDANTGEDGAAIYASIHCTVTVRDTIVKDNKATDQGAGFFCDQSTYSLYNVSFSNNVAGKTPSSSKEQDMYCDTLEANGFCEVDGDPLWSKHCKLAYDSGKVPLPKWLVGTLIGLGVFIFLLILAVAFWMYQVRRRSRATASPDGSGGYEHLSTDDADTTEGPRTTQLGPWGVVTNPNDIHYADETEEDVDDGLVQNRQNFSDD
jgi:predicted outer membrane repeat protein